MFQTEKMPITGHTGLIALLGSPVSHSLSPLMHNEAFRLLGLDYCYLCFDVNDQKLPGVVSALRDMGLRGFNLTMPDKTAILPLLDELSPAASLIGAVNTVVNEEGRLVGHNTDGVGFVRALAQEGQLVEGRDFTLLGAGGAATALLVQLALDGARSIRICLRPESARAAHMEELCGRVRKETSCHLTLVPFDQMATAIQESEVLINATNVGMGEGNTACPLTDLSLLRPDLFVADVIYHPLKTQLLIEAEKRGASTMNGLGMLLYQGAEAFRLWTGQEMPIAKIRQKLFG